MNTRFALFTRNTSGTFFLRTAIFSLLALFCFVQASTAQTGLPCCAKLEVKLDEVQVNLTPKTPTSLPFTESMLMMMPRASDGVIIPVTVEATLNVSPSVTISQNTGIGNGDDVVVTGTFKLASGPPVRASMNILSDGPGLGASLSNVVLTTGGTTLTTTTDKFVFSTYAIHPWGAGSAYFARANIAPPGIQGSGKISLKAIFACDPGLEPPPAVVTPPAPLHGCQVCGPDTPTSRNADTGYYSVCPPGDLQKLGRQVDYSALINAGGCSCAGGGGVGASSDFGQGATTEGGFSLARRVHPSLHGIQGSSSAGIFFEDIDTHMTFYAQTNGSHVAILFDPNSGNRYLFKDRGFKGEYDLRSATDAVDVIHYYDSFELRKNGDGDMVLEPNLARSENVEAIVTRHNGWKYTFQLGTKSLNSGDFPGRLIKLESPEGYVKNIVYQSFTTTELAADPTLQYKIDTVSDNRGNSAVFTYVATQQAGRWVVEQVAINTDQYILNYAYIDDTTAGTGSHIANHTAMGTLSEIRGSCDVAQAGELIAKYRYYVEYGLLQKDQFSNDLVFEWDLLLNKSYTAKGSAVYTGSYSFDPTSGVEHLMTVQYSGRLKERRDGLGDTYYTIAPSGTAGVYVINTQGQQAQWAENTSLQYYDPDLGTSGAYEATE